MKFVHAADLHLDSPLRGLPAYEGAPVEEVRGATRRALENLVELCVEESAELLVIAGDLYDGDWKDYSTGLFFLQQMARLRDAGVQVAWVRGNHDASSKITRYLSPPENVTELSFSAPETVLYENCGVAVHGVGYATAEVRENLALSYPEPRPGLLNVGLLHTSLDGRPGHAPYAPCALDQLRARGYDYWALGHVHAREVLSREPWIVFSGNLQGRHIHEVGPKGATLVTVEGGQVRAAEHRALDVVRWARCDVDLEGATTFDEAIERAAGRLRTLLLEADGRLLACRVTLQGRSAAHAALLARPDRVLAELRALGLSWGNAYIERVELRTGPAVDLSTLRQREDALGELFRSVDELRAEGEALEELRAEVLRGLEGLAQDVVRSESDAEELLLAAERLLLGRLLGSGDAEPRP